LNFPSPSLDLNPLLNLGKLQVKPEAVENAILALCYLLSEAAKVNLNEIDFIDSLLALGYPDDHNTAIKQVRDTNTILC